MSKEEKKEYNNFRSKLSRSRKKNPVTELSEDKDEHPKSPDQKEATDEDTKVKEIANGKRSRHKDTETKVDKRAKKTALMH